MFTILFIASSSQNSQKARGKIASTSAVKKPLKTKVQNGKNVLAEDCVLCKNSKVFDCRGSKYTNQRKAF